MDVSTCDFVKESISEQWVGKVIDILFHVVCECECVSELVDLLYGWILPQCFER